MYASAVAGWLLDVQLTDFLIKFRELRPSLGAPGGGGEGISTNKGVNKIITTHNIPRRIYAMPDKDHLNHACLYKCLYGHMS